MEGGSALGVGGGDEISIIPSCFTPRGGGCRLISLGLFFHPLGFSSKPFSFLPFLYLSRSTRHIQYYFKKKKRGRGGEIYLNRSRRGLVWREERRNQI